MPLQLQPSASSSTPVLSFDTSRVIAAAKGVSFGPSGNTLLCGFHNYGALFWSSISGSSGSGEVPLLLDAANDTRFNVNCVASAGSSQQAFIGLSKGGVQLFDVNKPRTALLENLSLHEEGAKVQCVAVDGSQQQQPTLMISGGRDNKCLLLDTRQGFHKPVAEFGSDCKFQNVHTSQPLCLQLNTNSNSSNHRLIVGYENNVAKVWDTRITHSSLHVLQMHTRSVNCLQFDERKLVTAGADGRLAVHDLHAAAAGDNVSTAVAVIDMQPHTGIAQPIQCMQFDDRKMLLGMGDQRLYHMDFTGAALSSSSAAE
jgi:WD40 repeat protein